MESGIYIHIDNYSAKEMVYLRPSGCRWTEAAACRKGGTVLRECCHRRREEGGLQGDSCQRKQSKGEGVRGKQLRTLRDRFRLEK